MSTEKQKEVVRKTFENVGKSKGEILREVGYSKTISENPKKIYESKGVQEEMEPFIERLKKARNRALANLETSEGDAKYSDFVTAVDKFTGKIELLSGGFTERIKYDWDDYGDKDSENL